jgi:hypothetical protein
MGIRLIARGDIYPEKTKRREKMGLVAHSNCSVYSTTNLNKTFAPNPNPVNFKIIEVHGIGKHLVAKIKYPDCTNFEGIKICVFKNMTKETLKNMKSIDPHFSTENKAPFARFQPTKSGWQAACSLANSL